MTLQALRRTSIRALLILTAVVVITAISALASSYFVSKQLTALLKRQTATTDSARVDIAEPLIDINFYEASGIEPASLRKFLADAATRDHLNEYPAHLSFENEAGECLIDHPVAIHWDAGTQVVNVGQTGVLRIMLRSELLPGLKFQVPQRFRRMKQHTIPLGTAYEPYAAAEQPGLGRHVVNDFDISMEMWRQLARLRAAGSGLDAAAWRTQIQRRHSSRNLPATPAEAARSMTTSEIYRERRDSVVVIGHLLADGGVVHAAGVVLDAKGLIATAYHVVDKPTAVARCVLTSDGKAFPIQEILAADQPNDVAIVRIDATDLAAVPLSAGDDEGTPLTILSHPAGEFYSVTQGHLRRFHASVFMGKQVARMSVTADFTDGASGGPVFNDRGELAGIVSLQHPTTANLASRIAAPARAVRSLFHAPLP